MSGYNFQGQNIIPSTPGQNGVKVLFGLEPGSPSTNTGTVTFSTPFTSAPTILANIINQGQVSLFTIDIYNITTTTFNYAKYYYNTGAGGGVSASNSEPFNWVAIGN